MSSHRPLTIVLLSLGAFGTAAQRSDADSTFLGPTPYLSKADSPFPVESNNSNFHLEDFEDGLFNALGIVLPSDMDARGIVLAPGDLNTNSVDGDDGQIDGMGKLGHALMSTVYTTNLVDPPTSSSYVSLSFDAEQLGFLPTAIGFVWTYGRQNSTVRIDIFDDHSQSLGFEISSGIGTGEDNDSSDDRFFGVINRAGIRSALITTSYSGNPAFFEIDHVQFGVAVPESATIPLVAVGAFALMKRGGLLTSRREHGHCPGPVRAERAVHQRGVVARARARGPVMASPVL